MKIEYNGKQFSKIKELLEETTVANIDKFLFDNEKISLSDFVGMQENENQKDARGSASNSGDNGSASNSGNNGSASNSGDWGSASNSGYSGSASNSGDSGSASNSGDSGSASNSGDWGSASNSGYRGSASNSGDWGSVMSNAFFSAISNRAGLYGMITEFVFDNLIDGEGFPKEKIIKQNAKLIKFTKEMEGKFYTLFKNKIYEVVELDNIKMIVLEKKEINGYRVIKGIQYENDFTIYNKQCKIEEIKKLLVVEKDGIFSHGETVEQAIKDFRYKIGNRDTSAFNYLKTTKDEISTDEFIKAYRVITGSCEFGTKDFVEKYELKEKYTVKEALQFLKSKNAYRVEMFEEFFNKK